MCTFILLTFCINGFGEDSDKRKIYLYLEGRAVFEEMCIQCHGKYGKGDGEWAKDWTENRPRNFREGVFKFRTTPLGKLPTDEDLKRTISKGISGTAMPAFGKHLRDSQYDAVIEYLKHLSRKWKDPENAAKPLVIPSQPDWVKSTEDREAKLVQAKELFTKNCASCHGETGKGDGPAGLQLMDIWGFPVKPADFSKKHYKSGDRYEDVYRTIALGLDGTPMVGFHGLMSEEEIWSLVVYVFSLRNNN
ncbi:MAG: c-type cytochrome [Verrucomicrobiales bacterium]|nr:c-type cytochrome [Verrucomicrobiales bacterium]